MGATMPQLRVAWIQTSVCGRDMIESVTKQNEARLPKCLVVVYEDPSIRERAVRFCESMADQKHSSQSEREWWSFSVLSEPAAAHDAVEKAASADIVVFAMDSRGDLPHAIKLWIEQWLNKRGEREGALVGLLGREDGRGEVASFREIYLRHTARRAGMDYLSRAVPTLRRAIPDSIDSFSERAGRMTSVLDEILQKHPHSPPPVL